ncbi:MAG: hypothetical protein J6Q94_01040 [Clostridia bacterium]|nr:hypothetical protein [Clostridia bacterium]
MQKLTEQYSLVDAVLNPTAAMEMYKKLRQYEQSETEPAEVIKIKVQNKGLRSLINSLRKELSNRVG